jgi:hypothetical protein
MKIYRSTVLGKLRDLLGNQTLSDTVPMETGNNIVPVVEVGEKTSSFIFSSSVTTSAQSTLLSVDKTCFITSLTMAITKDVASDCTQMYATLRYINEGSVTAVDISIPLQTLTAGNTQVVIPFPYPLKLVSRGSALPARILFTCSPSTVGTLVGKATVTGYYLD